MEPTPVPPTATAWVLVSAAGSGTLENQTNQIVLYRTDAALPAPSVTVGHHLGRDKREAWSFDPPRPCTRGWPCRAAACW